MNKPRYFDSFYTVLFDVLFERREIGENRPYGELAAVARLANATIVDADLLGDGVVAPHQQRVELELCRLLLGVVEFLAEFFGGRQHIVVGGAQQHPPPDDWANSMPMGSLITSFVSWSNSMSSDCAARCC